jgi:hypothetical protein
MNTSSLSSSYLPPVADVQGVDRQSTKYNYLYKTPSSLPVWSDDSSPCSSQLPLRDDHVFHGDNEYTVIKGVGGIDYNDPQICLKSIHSDNLIYPRVSNVLFFQRKGNSPKERLGRIKNQGKSQKNIGNG